MGHIHVGIIKGAHVIQWLQIDLLIIGWTSFTNL
jgi:hypothetical protein